MQFSIKGQSIFRVCFLSICTNLVIVTMIAGPANAQSFTRVTTGPVVFDGKGSRSVNFVDVDNDGWLDLFISNGKSGGENNLLYLNNGDGTFAQNTTYSLTLDGGSSDGASFADMDNDGDLDVYVANWYNQQNFMHRNNGDGSFTKITTGTPVTSGGYSEACSWVDYDNDGSLDLFVANSGGNLRNFMFKGDGSGGFTKIDTGIIPTHQIPSRLLTWSDYDNDGDMDAFCANESDGGSFFNKLYRNDDSTFVDVTTPAIGTGDGLAWGASWGDYDNDGDMDLFVATNFNQPNKLYQNDGDGTFTEITTGPVVTTLSWSAGSSFIDYDNDGDLDLFVANGYHPGGFKHPCFLYTNDGTGNFTAVTGVDLVTDSGWAYGCAWGDIDHDGDLDVAIAGWQNETENNRLYLNGSAGSNHWLSLTLTGIESNASAIGARIRVKATIGGNPVWQTREITSTDGYCAQNGLVAHIGLGDATSVDSITIDWPSGITTVEENVTADQFLNLVECTDTDGDRICDGNDACPLDPLNDADGDGLCAEVDNCPDNFNPGQEDTDLDGVGNVCDLCCNLPGDADYNGSVNIADVTFLIARIFSGGPAPVCQDAADADGSNAVNIADVTYLISRIFSSGPAPICGATGT